MCPACVWYDMIGWAQRQVVPPPVFLGRGQGEQGTSREGQAWEKEPPGAAARVGGAVDARAHRVCHVLGQRVPREFSSISPLQISTLECFNNPYMSPREFSLFVPPQTKNNYFTKQPHLYIYVLVCTPYGTVYFLCVFP